MPKKLQAALPFKSKPKLEEPRKRKTLEQKARRRAALRRPPLRAAARVPQLSAQIEPPSVSSVAGGDTVCARSNMLLGWLVSGRQRVQMRRRPATPGPPGLGSAFHTSDSFLSLTSERPPCRP